MESDLIIASYLHSTYFIYQHSLYLIEHTPVTTFLIYHTVTKQPPLEYGSMHIGTKGARGAKEFPTFG